MNKAKVIIVGGGPAGCAAAYALAKESISVTVIEQGKPGKDKACGDALMPSAINIINMFGIGQDRLRELGGYRYDRVDICVDKSFLRKSVFKDNAGWVVPRAIIDQEIRNITGEFASFQYETRVTDLIVEPTMNPTLFIKYQDGKNEQVECDAVILATGSKNQLSKKLNIEGKPNKAFAISVYAEIPESDAHVIQSIDSNLPVYWWIFPISKNVANIGVGVFNNNLETNVKLLFKEFLEEHHAVPLGKCRGGMCHLWSGLGQCWNHKAGVVSCGDAAGLINPYTGEGMTAALRSGEHAGKAISHYLLRNRDPLILDEYSKWIIKHFTHQYKLKPLA